jgi:hypothetical protein
MAKVTISGKVTDFNKHPIEGADVVLLDDLFSPVTQTTSDARGDYALQAEPGRYNALFAAKDYKTGNLEYWAWNVPATGNLTINPKIDGLELYALNAFMPQGGLPSLFVYFRPMSLSRYNATVKPEPKDKKQPETVLYDISPRLTKEDIKIKIGTEDAKVIEVNNIKEQTGNFEAMPAYLVQCVFPSDPESLKFVPVEITITDPETQETGSACIYWKRWTKET